MSIPDPIWKGCDPTNYQLGRLGESIELVVLHTIVGSLQSAEQAFWIPDRERSAHYGIAYDGSYYDQFIAEANTAFHASNYAVNLHSIGIEHDDQGRYNDPRPDGLYALSAAVVNDICHRYQLPIDRDHVKAHHEVAAEGHGTECPDGLDVDRIVRQAQEIDNPPPPPPPPPPPEDDAMSTYAKLVPANGSDKFANLYRGTVASGRVRHVFIDCYADTQDGPHGGVVTLFTQDQHGNVGGPRTLTVVPSQDSARLEIDWVTGGFALAVKSAVPQSIEVAVNTEDWPA